MTRPTKSALVLDGDTVKFRLQADRTHTKSLVHLDWLRFSCYTRNADVPSVDNLFPLPTPTDNIWEQRSNALPRLIASTPDCDFAPATQAHELALKVCAILGPDFTVAQDLRKGHDFYKFRWSIERANTECGWVGFGASSKRAMQSGQGKTLHVNLYGMACTFAQLGWANPMADLIDELDADITRTDLALDFFDGYPGGILAIEDDFDNGLMNINGRKLGPPNYIGDWSKTGGGRSFYFGSKESGKQTNAYEKGDQLYGREAGSQWLRIELRHGNKQRVLPSDMLRRPADFFAGASDWHAAALAKADALQVQPERIKVTARLALETVDAEISRAVRWAVNVAAPTVAMAFEHLGDEFLHLVTGTKRPGRLGKFMPGEVASGFKRFLAAGGICPTPMQAV